MSTKIILDYIEKNGVFLDTEEKKNMYVVHKLATDEGALDFYSRLSLLDREVILNVFDITKSIANTMLQDQNIKQKKKDIVKTLIDQIDDVLDLEAQIREKEEELMKENNGTYVIPLSDITKKRIDFKARDDLQHIDTDSDSDDSLKEDEESDKK